MHRLFNTPQKRKGASPSKVPLNGLFSDGNWQCNCNPRLSAVRFQVKKEGPNTGRWFYTCQEPKETGCGFFLWDDKAKGREMGAVLNNTRTEPHTPDSRIPVTPSKNKRTLEGHAMASNKWLQDLGKKGEDEFGEWPLTREDEEKVVKTVERTDPGSFPETPRKGMDSRATTPGSKRKRGEEESNGASMYPTPATKGTRDEDIFGTPSTSRRRLNGGIWDGNERSALFGPFESETPSPFKFKDATIGAPPKFMVSPSPSITGDLQPSHDVTEDIMNILQDQHIDEEADAKLRQVLNRHALKISGIVKGRDITRAALKSKDTKIAGLQQKIMVLEHKRDMDEAIIKRLRVQNTG
ncbi:hypothetical protein SBOR_4589 [Sclerotinia borealis F-4128]|uniref:GRF-type domain-containing protein n=1 Tax=Sclerotinia borealis (strain F-4128) TaxID=1432307 RepID=W9CGR1_SCLBF|nr:hypothetical protein SBOR_4589 [Sclerotinia borealis F-4128]